MIEAFPFPWVSVVHPPTWIRLLQEQLQHRQHGQGGLGKSAQALPYSPCSRGQGQEGAMNPGYLLLHPATVLAGDTAGDRHV